MSAYPSRFGLRPLTIKKSYGGFNYAFQTLRPDEEGPQNFIEVTEVTKDGAAWLKLKFREVDLGNARLVISSPTSGRSQTFTAIQLKEWEGWSASFPGERLRVQLHVQEGSRTPLPVDALIEHVMVGESLFPRKLYPEEGSPQIPEQQALDDKEEEPCGTDTRTFSKEPRVGRLFPAMCTVFILEGGVYATAGHCFRTNRVQEVQFNVPLSSQIGIPNFSSPEDTYQVIATSIICSDCISDQNLKHGKDWAVFLLSKNTVTHREAIDAQGGSIKISSDLTIAGHPITHIRIDGFGWDNEPPIAMYANQNARGRFLGLAPDSNDEDAELRHFVATEGGNSGSPMMAIDGAKSDTDVVVGIHTGGRCNPETNTPNKGTGFSHQGLLQAVATLRQLHSAKQ